MHSDVRGEGYAKHLPRVVISSPSKSSVPFQAASNLELLLSLCRGGATLAFPLCFPILNSNFTG